MDVSLLVGGLGLRAIEAATTPVAKSASVPGAPHASLANDLVRGPDADYAIASSSTCGGSADSRGTVYRITAEAALTVTTADGNLLGGAHHAWLMIYPATNASPIGSSGPRITMTPVGGGQTFELPRMPFQ